MGGLIGCLLFDIWKFYSIVDRLEYVKKVVKFMLIVESIFLEKSKYEWMLVYMVENGIR